MEIELFLREILRQEKFSHTSGGGDHALKFLEKLKNDGKEEVICEDCKEPIVPYPAFKCSACRFICHVSCFGSTRLYKSTFYIHFGRRHEQLIFTEELKNDGEGVVCMVCKEKVEGPGYKCSASECNFQLHKSCAQLPCEMHHPLHPNHILILQRPSQFPNNCNACRKSFDTCLFYRCEEWDFVIDTTCANRTQVNNTSDCQHAFVPFFRKIHFTCEACGREGTDFASSCTICRLLIHSRCAEFPGTVIISRHDHTLTLTYSLHHQVKDFNVFCKLCGQKVKIEYAAFSCQECDFVAHLYCAKAYRRESLLEKSVDVMEKTINPEIIEHEGHQHPLFLHVRSNKNCNACDDDSEGLKDAIFVCTSTCDFTLGFECATLSLVARHKYDEHPLALTYVVEDDSEEYYCLICEEEMDQKYIDRVKSQ
ncbi:uncharacterized protein LOC132191581 [Corylus avellana]|uniref:uncharacterized protein LOC132191581 n=1 Tax=Corylus avellana TaxID=13451 RepID=UPI00286AE54C|nr:uncharacterized protein LOC132191581 [Corylus avellana]